MKDSGGFLTPEEADGSRYVLMHAELIEMLGRGWSTPFRAMIKHDDGREITLVFRHYPEAPEDRLCKNFQECGHIVVYGGRGGIQKYCSRCRKKRVPQRDCARRLRRKRATPPPTPPR